MRLHAFRIHFAGRDVVSIAVEITFFGKNSHVSELLMLCPSNYSEKTTINSFSIFINSTTVYCVTVKPVYIPPSRLFSSLHFGKDH